MAPIFDLEKLWLRAVCCYEVLDAPIMSDGEWDELTKTLVSRWSELSSVFRHCVPLACLASSTGSGIDWSKGAPASVLETERARIAYDPEQF